MTLSSIDLLQESRLFGKEGFLGFLKLVDEVLEVVAFALEFCDLFILSRSIIIYYNHSMVIIQR